MSTKNEVLTLLSQVPGKFFSGQEIADTLGVTRASVWKAIKVLRESGYNIEAVTNKGYALAEARDSLTDAGISVLIGDLPFKIEVYDTIGSTNSLVRSRAADGESEGLVIVAAQQTDGRGRNGRDFFSPPETGLYMSILLRPQMSAGEAQLLTVLAAVAAARACESVSGQNIGIKWVNDLFCRGKKVCGILTEASLSLETGGLDFAVLGLGFNITDPKDGWDDSLKDIAGGIFDSAPPIGTREKLASAFLCEFWKLYTSFNVADFLPEYRQRQVLFGREIEVISPSTPPRRAVAQMIDDNCHLIVRYSDTGEEASLSAGEVRIIYK